MTPRPASRDDPGMSTRAVLRVLSGYYLMTGAWPLVHMRSFLFITGPKRDLWLVRTVGLLVGAIGTSLALASFRERVALESRALALVAAPALALIEVTSVARRRIRIVYLLDAVVEAAFIAALLTARDDDARR